MQPEFWHSLKRIFGEALELAGNEREDYIAGACAGDSALESEVRRLLKEHEAASGFLSEAAVQVGEPDSQPRLAPGETLAGRFRIIRFIAGGGMGEVYEAEDLTLRDRVALKLIRNSLASKAKALELFRREIQLARKVTHLNVCRGFDLGTHEDARGRLWFLTMELVDGITLARRLSENGPIHPEQALPLILQMASALDAAHSAGVVHRDFKPGNVMLTGDPPRVVVTDFGLALRASSMRRGGSTSSGGTPRYMAPEQRLGAPITPAVDTWAFGVVIGEMTGELAPPSWKAIIGRCCDPDPARRPSSAGEAARDLALALHPRARWLSAVAALVATALAGTLLMMPARVLGGSEDGKVSLSQVSDEVDEETLAISALGDSAVTRNAKTGDLSFRDLESNSSRTIFQQSGTYPYSAEFSPDGRRLAVEFYQRTGNWILKLITIDPLRIRTLIEDVHIRRCRPLAWNPRRDEVLLLINENGFRYALFSFTDNKLRYLTAPTERFLGNAIFSPDGESVVFSAPQAGEELGNDLYIMPRVGGESKLLLELPADESPAAFSSDGRLLLFRSDSSLYAVDWSAGEVADDPVLLHRDLGAFQALRLTAGGDLFHYRQTGEMNVFLSKINPLLGYTLAPPRPVGKRQFGDSSSPTWSLSGKRLLYKRNLPGFGSSLGILDLDSGKIREIPVRLPVFVRPQWYGGERYAVGFGQPQEGEPGHYRVDTQTGDYELLVGVKEIQSSFEGVWTRDGRVNFNRFNQPGLGLFRFDLQSRTRKLLYVPPSNMNLGRDNLRLSPNEKTLAFQLFEKDGEEAHLMTIGTGGGEPRRLWTVRKPYWFLYGSFTWTADGTGIVVARSKGQEGADLWYVPLSGDPPRLIDFPRLPMMGLHLNPDGRSLAFFGGSSKTTVWVLKGVLSELRRWSGRTQGTEKRGSVSLCSLCSWSSPRRPA